MTGARVTKSCAMRRFTLVAFAIVGLAQSLCAQEKGSIIPGDWLPPLTPSIRSALDQLKEANSQAEMNRLSRDVADMTDAQLFIAYVRLYERLSPKQREALVVEQEKWLKDRAKAAAAGVQSEGGSLAPLEANNAEVTFTEKRLSELRARLKSAPAAEATPAKAQPVKKKKKQQAKKKSGGD